MSLCIACNDEGEEKTFPLFSEEDATANFSVMFNQVTGIDLLDNDAVPKRICYLCAEKLKNAYEFRSKCLSIHLKRLKHTEDYSGKDSIKVEVCENSIFEPQTELVEYCNVKSSEVELNDERSLSRGEDSHENSSFDPFIGIADHFLKDSVSKVHVKGLKVRKRKKGVNWADRIKNFTIIQSPVETVGVIPMNPKKCNYCHEEFPDLVLRKEHEVIHKTEPKPYRCGYENCGKSFKSRPSINSHISRHKSTTTYQCNLCSKLIHTRNNAVIHSRQHTVERPFLCSYCGKAFNVKSNMQQHVRQHTGEKPLACHLCPKTFATAHSHKVHIRIHLQEKPFLCSHCGKSFVSSSRLTSHVRIHTGDRPYQCDVCTAAFHDKNGLNRHKKRH